MCAAKIFITTLIAGFAGLLCAAEEPTAEQLEFFETKIRPLLAEHCYKCHSGRSKKLKAELRVDSHAALLKGGESGPAIVPGKSNDSLLIKAVRFESVEMPPDAKLPEEKIAVLSRWVDMGAPWPQEEAIARENDGPNYDWDKFRREHWAFRPVTKPEVPQPADASSGQNEIDRFILTRLQAANLKPAPPVDARTLIRRIFLDLVGIPPAPDEIAEWTKVIAADSSLNQDGLRQLIDHLLESPHYGERWGRHWLDVARYSDGHGGFLDNAALPEAWRYRDWVVGAFNADMPYNEFVRLQIAGDLVEEKKEPLATGFFALGPKYNSDGGDPDSVAQAKGETLDDRVDTFSRAFLALTVSCARCHDHKFDPIPTMDYYSLAGVFNNTKRADKGIHILQEAGSSDMKVALRGNLRKQGPAAPRRFLQILSGDERPHFNQGSGRLQLAEAVVDPSNPLTARVIVNRIWMHHYGKALVRSPSNFGMLGEKPTHPELLEWLTASFVENGWSIKSLHRTIMLSATYQRSSRYDENNFKIDGDNKLVWRMNPRRMDVESWRDSLLAATGELDRTLGGGPTDNIVGSKRRTLYAKVSRNGDQFGSDHFLRLFDFPLMRATVAKRPISTVPQQFLFMMNSPFMVERAKALAERLKGEAKTNEERISRAYQLLFGRSPTDGEMQLGSRYLAQEPKDGQKLSDWEQYAQVLLSSNEFMYVR
ncbi:MAG: PSD1 and planctomycete cytochrome C domain-containing protein [Planctomycetota bacterium]|nr:PSD1 and planctomycete cytochrome C domain-containing protein [Planctomycetota bacterium]